MSSIQNNAQNSPHILVLGMMGGTIAGIAARPDENPMQYEAGRVEIASLLTHIQSAIPEEIKLVAQQVANINSRNLTEPLLSLLGEIVRAAIDNTLVKGIVITHTEPIRLKKPESFCSLPVENLLKIWAKESS
ncbi:asparaginase domain-containing protein [Polynucleobacter necessarius]|uniref:asparaginase domain-containing protein n=1 Tax=Polynucleobacter necessarius TaxID=576610 RepID=UPI0018D52845|nr:asparaginase domain-containing protein [Polynucleobacter necessarius]